MFGPPVSEEFISCLLVSESTFILFLVYLRDCDLWPFASENVPIYVVIGFPCLSNLDGLPISNSLPFLTTIVFLVCFSLRDFLRYPRDGSILSIDDYEILLTDWSSFIVSSIFLDCNYPLESCILRPFFWLILLNKGKIFIK